MADLLDIAPSAAVDVVIISGGTVDIRRLGVDDMAALAMRYSSVLAFLGGVGGDGNTAVLPGPAMAAVIAAGCGHLGDEKMEAKASEFLIEDQFKLLNAILRITFPNGLSSVQQAFESLATTLAGGATEVPKVVKMRLKPSPSPSPPSSEEVSRQTM